MGPIRQHPADSIDVMVPANTPLSVPSRTCTLGFSLIELMVVISVLAILASIAAPSFQDSFEAYRVASARENLVSTIQFARTEAIRTGQPVVVRRKADCASNNWGCGWVVFRDTNGNNTQQAGEASIRETETQRGVSIRSNAGSADFQAVNIFGQFAGSPFFSFFIGPTPNDDANNCTRVAFSSAMRALSTKGSGSGFCP
ncbi:prepilin-type N-terminal cleavage/methylation domain-containing protein [Hydrogenophaga sp. D2P1]|uniref:Type II secretion system protein H n=2 Tax=Hydrogenophaga aromaticivorans TaxID=2610898 RepID=A0A7Y8KWG1_9BURK|nr:prepilin-type N-terminal cleavage/methylation domain-containing protein [Hydrogenophaga aromaticivorans]